MTTLDVRSAAIRDQVYGCWMGKNCGGNEESYATVQLQAGWNELLLKFVRAAEAPAPEAHFVVSSADRLHDGLDRLGWTRLAEDMR